MMIFQLFRDYEFDFREKAFKQHTGCLEERDSQSPSQCLTGNVDLYYFIHAFFALYTSFSILVLSYVRVAVCPWFLEYLERPAVASEGFPRKIKRYFNRRFSVRPLKMASMGMVDSNLQFEFKFRFIVVFS